MSPQYGSYYFSWKVTKSHLIQRPWTSLWLCQKLLNKVTALPVVSKCQFIPSNGGMIMSQRDHCRCLDSSYLHFSSSEMWMTKHCGLCAWVAWVANIILSYLIVILATPGNSNLSFFFCILDGHQLMFELFLISSVVHSTYPTYYAAFAFAFIQCNILASKTQDCGSP